MSKGTFSRLASFINAPSVINGIITQIEAAFQNTVSRDGSSPNQMSASLDMNSNRILNLPTPVSDGEPLRRSDLSLVGTAGYAPWLPIADWTASTLYTATAPASLVRYSNAVYVCTTSHTSGSSFDSSKFTKIIDSTAPHVANQVFYTDVAGAQPNIVALGDRAVFGAPLSYGFTTTSVAGIEAEFTNPGSWGWGWRDGQVLQVGHTGIGFSSFMENRDLNANTAGYRSAFNYAAFMTSTGEAATAATENFYAENTRAADNVVALNMELDLANAYNAPPTNNPYTLNLQGSTVGIALGDGITNHSGVWQYMRSAAINIGAGYSGNLTGITFGEKSVNGTNGKTGQTITVTATAGSPDVTLNTPSDIDLVNTGMFSSDSWISGGSAVILAKHKNQNKLKLSSNASSSGVKTLTLANLGGPAIQMATGDRGHRIEWTNTDGSKAAWIRADFPSVVTTGNALLFNSNGLNIVNADAFPGSETVAARIDTSGRYYVQGKQVVGFRETGWSGTWSGSAADKTSSFDTGTVTTAQLAQRVRALEDMLRNHGLLGT